MDNIGGRIKQMRTDQHLSLKELANKTGTTPSFLSQVENNKCSPSLAALKSITDALNTTISNILGEQTAPKKNDEYQLIKKEERKILKNIGVGLELQFLSNFDKNNVLEPSIHVIQPRIVSGIPPYQHDGQEFILLLKGKMELTINKEKVLLHEGDSCYFDSGYEHTFTNISEDKVCEVLCVSTNGFFIK